MFGWIARKSRVEALAAELHEAVQRQDEIGNEVRGVHERLDRAETFQITLDGNVAATCSDAAAMRHDLAELVAKVEACLQAQVGLREDLADMRAIMARLDHKLQIGLEESERAAAALFTRIEQDRRPARPAKLS